MARQFGPAVLIYPFEHALATARDEIAHLGVEPSLLLGGRCSRVTDLHVLLLSHCIKNVAAIVSQIRSADPCATPTAGATVVSLGKSLLRRPAASSRKPIRGQKREIRRDDQLVEPGLSAFVDEPVEAL